MSDSTHGTGALAPSGALRPFAVPIHKARVLLGDKSRSEIYVAAGRGELDLVKDGAKTLVTLSSIERYQHKLTPLRVKSFAPRQKRPRRSRKSITT
jgi:hypothetical protein